MMSERRIIKEFPAYEITREGKIYNRHRNNLKSVQKAKNRWSVWLQKSMPSSKGYLRSMTFSRSIHILVAKEFVENDDPGYKSFVIFIDGNPDNYHASNLAWSYTRNSYDI